MVQSEIFWMVLFSDNLLSLKISLDWFLVGKNLLLLVDMLLVISIKLQILLWTNLANFKFFSKLMMELNKEWKCIITKELVVLEWACITQIKVYKVLLIAALILLFKDNILCTWLLRIQSWRSMMEDLRIFSKEFIKKNIRRNFKLKNYGMNIGLLMIWLHIWLSPMVGMFGLVKIMMVMFNLTVLLKVLSSLYSRLWISWFDDFGVSCTRWIGWSWSCPRNSYQALQNASTRKVDFN